MAIGRVELADGRWVLGFGCTQEAAEQGKDITDYGNWRAWLLRNEVPLLQAEPTGQGGAE